MSLARFFSIPPLFKAGMLSLEGVWLDRLVDRFIREGSCRRGRSLGSPCVSFDAGAKGVCKRDGRICDLLTEKGERYMSEYE